MKANLGMAAVIAVGTSVVGVGALDSVPEMYGSDRMRDLTLQVLSGCGRLLQAHSPIAYYDGTSSGETGPQMIAPMSRPVGTRACILDQRPGAKAAEGMVIALDALSVVGNSATVGPEGIDYPGVAGVPENDWRQVLRLIYTGMPSSVGFNVFQRDCNSDARRAIVNNWDNVFHGTVTSCTDSHPSVPGVGARAYDASNSIIEPGVRHAFRRDDVSGTTDAFLMQLGLNPIDFAAPAPGGSNPVQTAVYQALANSPFCNVKRPEDKWQPNTMPANTTRGFFASQIPEMINVGVPGGAGTGLGYAPHLKNSTFAKSMGPYFNEYSDQDPIRRQCVGRGSNATPDLPMEQVCGADGTLGVVLPISVPPQLFPGQAYPSIRCEPGMGFKFGPGLTRPNGSPVRCPNGDVTQDSKCLLPVRHDGAFWAFDCINPPGNVPAAPVDHSGDPTRFTDAPLTDGREDVDGRVYNLILRQADGTIRTVNRPDPTGRGLISTPIAGAFYRIHATRSLLLPPAHTANTCTRMETDDQLGCLVTASPCSIGYGSRKAVVNNPGTETALVNGVAPNKTTIQALYLGGVRYPFAHKVYLNATYGFESLLNSDPTVPGDAELELAKCFATLPFNGSIDVTTLGFVKLPPPRGSATEKPLCEDFYDRRCELINSNADACLGNEAIGDGSIPTSYCDNGLRDGEETGPDVCPSFDHPTCNTSTHHCE
jgi:hypothetical protein